MKTRQMISCEQRFSVFERDGFRCVYCGRSAKDGQYLSVAFHADHLYPHAHGGADADDNLVTACSDCNIGKSERIVERLPPGLPASVMEHFFSYFDESCGVEEPDRFYLPPMDRHLIAMLLYVPDSVAVVARFLDDDKLSAVTRQIIARAWQLLGNGCAVDLESLMDGLDDEAAVGAIAYVQALEASGFEIDQNEKDFRVRDLEECYRRRSAEQRARAAADALKTASLDVETESKLLELLERERRAAQGMDRRPTHGR